MMHLYVKRMLVAVLFVIAKKIKKVTTTTNPKNSNTEREEKKKYPPKTDNKLCKNVQSSLVQNRQKLKTMMVICLSTRDKL